MKKKKTKVDEVWIMEKWKVYKVKKGKDVGCWLIIVYLGKRP